MIPFKISIEQYRGTSYNISYCQGKQMNKSLIEMFSKIVNEDEIDLTGLKNIYSLHAPHLMKNCMG